MQMMRLNSHVPAYPALMKLLKFAFLAVSGLYWGAYLASGLRNAREIRAVKDLPDAQSETLPSLSVIIPACNEGNTIGAALEGWAGQDYPRLELILVNDRSSDNTGEIMERLASLDPRVRVRQVDALPPGWLGKVHALHVGTLEARGEWLLFTDADVHLHAGTLEKTVGHAVSRNLDHLVGIPQLQPLEFWLDIAVALFNRIPMLTMRVWDVENPHSKGSAGIGAFNLVRREALERTPGFEWLRLEVADDVTLGQMLKAHGARQSMVHGRDAITLQWYDSFTAMLRGTEKIWLSGTGNYQPAGLAAFIAVWTLLELSPFMALGLNPRAGAALIAVSYAVNLNARRFHDWKPVTPALLWPIGSLMLSYSALRAAWVTQKRGGLDWRGTLYPLQELRKGKRFKGF